jgi:hypothetical protein
MPYCVSSERWWKFRHMPIRPKGEKRPPDVIGGAVKVIRIATGEEPDDRGNGRSQAHARHRETPTRHSQDRETPTRQGVLTGTVGVWSVMSRIL